MTIYQLKKKDDGTLIASSKFLYLIYSVRSSCNFPTEIERVSSEQLNLL